MSAVRLGLGRSGAGTEWGWGGVGLGRSRAGAEWGWGRLGLGRSGAGTDWGWGGVGLGQSGTASNNDCSPTFEGYQNKEPTNADCRQLFWPGLCPSA